MIGNKLKCWFAFSDDITNNIVYKDMLVVALKSARENTSLDLWCLYDGRKGDELYKILQQYDVNIILHTIPFMSEIKRIYTPEYMMDKFGFVISDGSLRSRFLRMEIQQFETDDYFLYCDTDIMFMRDIKLTDFEHLPEYVGVCPEFNKSQDYDYFNAGIMLINTKHAKEKYSEFLNMIKSRTLASIECCDQGYLNDLYKGKFEKLPLEYNWKPYWGINNNAYIIHFHGVKPNTNVLSKQAYLYKAMYDNDSVPEAYYFYYGKFCKYGDIDVDTCFTKLDRMLICNMPHFSCAQRRKVLSKVKKSAIWCITGLLLIQILIGTLTILL